MTIRTEQQLLDATIDLATHCQWRVFHPRPARLTDGQWRTATQGHNGWPDLVLARRGLVLFRELKGYDRNGRIGRLSSEQRDWGKQLNPSDADWLHIGRDLHSVRRGLLFDVWTPDDWDTIIRPTLTAKITASR